MSNFQFRPAVRENVGLWINLIGGTGSGKTFTAMRLASGIAGSRPFVVLDTENRRALHYADQFKFDHAEIRPPFRPMAYQDAIVAADAAGYPVIVVDSGSHVWAGDGGILDWQEEELNRMAGDDYGKRERVKMSAWIKPKMAHKHMVQKLLQVKAHIILCLRAEEKIEMVKNSQGRLEVQKKQSLTGKDGWIPICDKSLPFEATCSFLLLASNPGIPNPIKLQEQHKALFPLDVPITEESGKRLASWATGALPINQPTAAPHVVDSGPANIGKPYDGELSDGGIPQAQFNAAAPVYISKEQITTLLSYCEQLGINVSRVLLKVKAQSVEQIPTDLYDRCISFIDAAAKVKP